MRRVYTEVNTGFVPLILRPEDVDQIPETVRDASHYLISGAVPGDAGYLNLRERLCQGRTWPPLPLPHLSHDQPPAPWDANIPTELVWEASERISKAVEQNERRSRQRHQVLAALIVVALCAVGGLVWKQWQIQFDLVVLKDRLEKQIDETFQARLAKLKDGGAEAKQIDQLNNWRVKIERQVDQTLASVQSSAEPERRFLTADAARVAQERGVEAALDLLTQRLEQIKKINNRKVEFPVFPGGVTLGEERDLPRFGQVPAETPGPQVPGAGQLSEPGNVTNQLDKKIYMLGVVAPAPAPAEAPTATPAAAKAGGMDAHYVLSALWQPAFCELHPGRAECRDQTPDRADARQFSLHGLWPQPIGRAYCGVSREDRAASESGNWERLPVPDLTPDTRAALEQRMPGASSGLERHEWTRHGSCYGTDAETYFTQAVALIDQLNASDVRQVFESSIGKRLRAEAVRSAFDRAFGPGSGERVRIECDPASQIMELRIGLKGTITDQSTLGDLIQAAPTRTVGCRGGWVDRAGPGR